MRVRNLNLQVQFDLQIERLQRSEIPRSERSKCTRMTCDQRETRSFLVRLAVGSSILERTRFPHDERQPPSDLSGGERP